MLDMSRTRIRETRPVTLLSTATVDQEGLAMILSPENGREAAKPSTTGDDNIFLGVSWGERFSAPATTPRVEFKTLSGTTVTLDKVASATGEINVVVGADEYGNGGTKLAYSGSGPTNVQFGINGGLNVITVHADHTDKTIFIIYRTAMTVAEAQTLYGDAYPGVRANAMMGNGGLILHGEVFTDQFDTSINWNALDTVATAEVLRAGANGRFTAGSTGGASLAGTAHVIEAPSVGKPFLGLYIHI